MNLVTETASVTDTAAMEKEAMTICSALISFKDGATIRQLEKAYQVIKPGKRIDYVQLNVVGMVDILSYLQRQGKAKEVSPGKWVADNVPGAEHMKYIVEQTKKKSRVERGKKWKSKGPTTAQHSAESCTAQPLKTPLFCLHCRKYGHEVQNQGPTTVQCNSMPTFITREGHKEHSTSPFTENSAPELARSHTRTSPPPEDPSVLSALPNNFEPQINLDPVPSCLYATLSAPVDTTEAPLDPKTRLLATLKEVLGSGGRTFPDLRKAYERASGRHFDTDLADAGYPEQLSLLEADGPCDIQGGLVVIRPGSNKTHKTEPTVVKSTGKDQDKPNIAAIVPSLEHKASLRRQPMAKTTAYPTSTPISLQRMPVPTEPALLPLYRNGTEYYTGLGTTGMLSPTNVYIRGLKPTTTDVDLRELCKDFGKITSTKAIIDKETGQCKGYGFVDFEKREDAEVAVKSLAANEIQAQMAKTSIQTKEQDPTNIYIANLPLHWSESNLEDMLKRFGVVLSARILRDKTDGVSRGVGFARMESKKTCDQIIKEFNGKTLPESSDPLVVKLADTGKKPKRGTEAQGSGGLVGVNGGLEPSGGYGGSGADLELNCHPMTSTFVSPVAGLAYTGSPYLTVLPQSFPYPGQPNHLGHQFMGLGNGAINTVGMPNQFAALSGMNPAAPIMPIQYGWAGDPPRMTATTHFSTHSHVTYLSQQPLEFVPGLRDMSEEATEGRF